MAVAARGTRREQGAAAALHRLLYENGLSLTLAAVFLATLLGQSLVGHHVFNDERTEHGQPTLAYGQYLVSEHFLEATFENWESEFLQMGAYVWLTVFLIQRGSAESNAPKHPTRTLPKKPWPVRRGGWILRLYEHSLSLTFGTLFLISFVMHGVSGAAHYNEDQRTHGGTEISTGAYFLSAQLWFESLQNWQSEFLAIMAMVVLSIFLREKGSPESKKVDAPNDETGV
jgi:hypothetical protein